VDVGVSGAPGVLARPPPDIAAAGPRPPPLQLRTDFLLSCPQMWGAYRCAAGFLVLVILVPAFGPLAMPCAALPQAMHCMRRPVSAQTASGQAASERPALPCHHTMAQPPPGESSEASYRAADDGNCCRNHCCCGATTSEWARPASSLLSFISLTIEPALPAQRVTVQSSEIFGHDSARAPPRS